MESCFIDEIRDTVEKVKALQEDGCLCFNIIADSHIAPLREESISRLYHTFENVKAVNEQADFHGIFHLGDLAWANSKKETRDYWTTENIEKWMGVFKENLHAANTNTYFIAGNHDGEYVSEPERPVWHRRMVEYQRDKITGYVKDEPYYYVDFDKEKVRAICMMSCYSEGEHTYTGIYKEQVDWLASDALQAPDGWSILLFTHVCPLKGFRSTDQDNLEEFAGFMTAFQKKERFDSELFPADFTNSTTAKVAAMFVGDGHVDWIAKPGVLPFYVIETGSNLLHCPKRGSSWTMPADCTVADRMSGTVTEDLWDAVVYNPKKATIDLIRFGAGEDRHIDLQKG